MRTGKFKRLLFPARKVSRACRSLLLLLVFVGVFFVCSDEQIRKETVPQPAQRESAEVQPAFQIRIKEGALDGSIFFFETSPLPFLKPKQLCSLESAALHHPHKSIVLGILNKDKLHPDNNFPPVKTLLKKYENIYFLPVDLEQWLAGTVLENWLGNRKLQKSKFRVNNASNILRLVAMLKYGGIYLDLDSIVIQSLDGLGNTVGLERLDFVNSAVLSFKTKNHGLLLNLLSSMAERFDGNTWGANGPRLWSMEVRRWCGIAENDTIGPKTCHKGLQIHPVEAFYPVDYTLWQQLFIPADTNATQTFSKKMENTYVISFWNRFSVEEPIMPGSLLGWAARKNCPVIMKSFGSKLWGISSPQSGSERGSML